MPGATWGGSTPASRVTMYEPSTTPGDGAAARPLRAIEGPAVRPRATSPSRTPSRTVVRERNEAAPLRRSSDTGGLLSPTGTLRTFWHESSSGEPFAPEWPIPACSHADFEEIGAAEQCPSATGRAQGPYRALRATGCG